MTHAVNRSWAVDNYDPENAFVSTIEIYNHNWAYADFAMAYDPNTSSTSQSIFRVELFGATIGLVDLFIGGVRENKVNSPASMVFTGGMNLSGTMTTYDQFEYATF